MDIRLVTLGSPKIYRGEEQLPSLPGKPVTFGLLVYLALERETSRDQLVGVFWPESTEERARGALSQTLYELRKDLGDEWVEAAGNLVRVTDTLSVDAKRFEELVKEEDFEAATPMYAGPFLHGVHLAKTRPFEDWVERQRGRFGRLNRAATSGFITAAGARGDLDAALKAASDWVALDPLEDEAQHHFIRLLAESGQRNEAVTQYQRYEELLERELGLEPLEETTELVQQIRDGTYEPPVSPQQDTEGSAPKDAVPVPSPPTTDDSADSWPAAGTKKSSEGPLMRHARTRAELQDLLEEELDPLVQVLRRIGHGSMAEVFLAKEVALRRFVAIKVLSPEHYRDSVARRRFRLEAQSAAQLDHQNVCQVYRVDKLRDGTPYLVMPYIKGPSLSERLKAEGRLGPREVRRVLRDIACGLAAAHKLGVVHRDVRPDNILYEEETGRHCLCDFGIAGVLDAAEGELGPKMTKTGEILGNPAYISPEQMDGDPLTDRADVYSLGILAHQLLTGHPPPPRTSGEHRKAPETVNLEPLEDYVGHADPVLVDLIKRCLAKNPAHRPSAQYIVEKLDQSKGPETDFIPPIPGRAGTFFQKLIERRFFQIVGGYVAGAWVLTEVISELEGRSLLPNQSFNLAFTTAVFGFFAVNILAWYHGKRGRQEWAKSELWMLGVVGVLWVVVSLFVLLM